MTNGKHTPGPWEARTFLVKGGYRLQDTIVHVGASTSLGPSRSNESEANASLIAAAPDLLNVATVFAASLEYLIAIDRKNGDDEGASMKGITLNVVKSAIAKAEGRS